MFENSTGPLEDRDIYVMNADGSNQIRLTIHPAADFEPDWSADGNRIAFSSDRDGNTEIYVMNPDQVRNPNRTVSEEFTFGGV
jgi:TolB protein